MEGDNPSTRKRGFSPSKPPTFPSTAWGCRPKTRRSAAHCLPSFPAENSRLFHSHFVAVFSRFKSIFEASLAPFAYAHYRVFACSHCSHFCRFAAKNTKTRGSFDFQKNFYCFPGTFSTLKSTFVGFPAWFRRSKALLRLPRRNFDFQKNFRAFPGAFSCFKSTFAAVFACFRPSKVLLRFTSACFLLSKELFQFGSNKNQYIKEFLWQK